jgi:hypothetical protein
MNTADEALLNKLMSKSSIKITYIKIISKKFVPQVDMARYIKAGNKPLKLNS